MVSQKYLIVVVAVSLLYSVYAQSPSKCKGADITLSDDQLAIVNDCLNSTGAASVKDVPKEQKGCFTKCVMTKQGLVDDAGMLKKDNIPKSLGSGIPDGVKGPLTTQIGQCFDQAGTKLDMSDPTCAAFAPLCDCVQAAYTAVCK